MPIQRDFVITLQGKDHVLYVGLLDAAHEAGLVSIETHLAQIPGPENGHLAICTATVRLVTPEGLQKTFTGIGDADQGNVNKRMATCLLRMAETRAKARALRDALNVTAELADDQSPDAGAPIDVPDQPHRPSPKAQTPAAPTPSPARSSSAAAPAAATGPTPAAPAANAVIAAHPVNRPPDNLEGPALRSVAVARAETAQADDRLSLALGYRARPAPDNESQLRGHLTNLLRAGELNGVPLEITRELSDIPLHTLAPTILSVETAIKQHLRDADPGAIQPAVPPKAKVAAG